MKKIVIIALSLCLLSGILFYFIHYKNCCADGDCTNAGKTEMNIKPEVKDESLKSVMTCPKCGHKKEEIMPTDVCQLKYTCDSCKTVITPKEGDCCVYCSYGSKKCPSMQ